MGAPQLSIKDAETTAMVRELAELTGESPSEVVRTAVRERLDRTRAEHDRSATADQDARRRERDRVLKNIRKLQADLRKHMRPGDFLTDADLYDEWGLPK